MDEGGTGTGASRSGGVRESRATALSDFSFAPAESVLHVAPNVSDDSTPAGTDWTVRVTEGEEESPVVARSASGLPSACLSPSLVCRSTAQSHAFLSASDE
jgi:hypothetical protein